ncbi:MAG: allophanate hydrolase [Cellvibrionaceae bacterium]
MTVFNDLDITISGLKQHYLKGDFTPTQLIEHLHKKYSEVTDNPIWISLLNLEQLSPYLHFLDDKSPDSLPLFGIPFAIKDNIDLKNIPTTAACPDFSYTPDNSAFVVQQLINAGAIPIGKTNLDQFATGLVGVRSPWGPVKNALNDNIISGGSSSGSAVAVSKQWVTFSLGTDTAGSGRVPASLNNIVGLKPTKGLLSTQGVVPACRSLDAVSIFSLTVDDANTVFNIAAQFDETDEYARKNTFNNGKFYYRTREILQNHSSPKLRIGVPKQNQFNFFNNTESTQIFKRSLDNIQQLNSTLIEIDFEPFIEAAKLLYEGPWVAERYLATLPLIEDSPNALLPVIRTIIENGKTFSALETFSFQYRLQALKQQADKILASVDMIITPTAGTFYSIDEVNKDPIQLNSNMGYYTNFMNLLDCSAVVVPASFYQNGIGFGVTLFHSAFADKRLLSLASEIQNAFTLPLGDSSLVTATINQNNIGKTPSRTINVVVCGAHLKNLPLNWQLTERGATLLEKTQSSPDYKLYALAGGPPFRPGMMRVDDGGESIEVEVWQVPIENFGSFVAEIPPPLGIGKVQLIDRRWESGFICEAHGINGAKDITELKSWKKYISEKTAPIK